MIAPSPKQYSELAARLARLETLLESNDALAPPGAVTLNDVEWVDADMNEESTRLQALQVQQQLGVQALSIANQNSQQILSLFR